MLLYTFKTVSMCSMKQTFLIALLIFSTLLLNTAKATNNKVGDLQYWNGTQWIQIPAPKGTPFKMTLCDGELTWVINKCPSKSHFHIGDLGPARGIVFDLSDSTGKHGLEAAPVDQSLNSQWGCYGLKTALVTSSSIGTGTANTTQIIDRCNQSGSGIAAKLANNYVFSGFADWYLPSIEELNQMFKTIGPRAPAPLTNAGGFSDALYWSSTGDGENAKGASISNSALFQIYTTTNVQLSVRAIRSF